MKILGCVNNLDGKLTFSILDFSICIYHTVFIRKIGPKLARIDYLSSSWVRVVENTRTV